jgi:hypothetical protein
MQTDVLRNCIRFPWDVSKSPVNSGKFNDSAVMERLEHESGFSSCFMVRPNDKALPHVMQSIALPTLMSLLHTKTRTVTERSLWKGLRPDVQDQILSLYPDFDREDHIFLFHMVQKQKQILTMASYMAATFAFTTYTVPLMIDFDDVTRALFSSMNGDFALSNAIEHAGLLIVLYPLGVYPGVDKISGPLFTMFAKRSDLGRPTVFLDLPQHDFARKISENRVPTREDFKTMAQMSVAGATRFGYYLAGPNTYRNSTIPIRGLNVGREALYF